MLVLTIVIYTNLDYFKDFMRQIIFDVVMSTDDWNLTMFLILCHSEVKTYNPVTDSTIGKSKKRKQREEEEEEEEEKPEEGILWWKHNFFYSCGQNLGNKP